MLLHTTKQTRILTIPPDKALFYRMQRNCAMDEHHLFVTEVKKLEPLPLRKEWMNDLAQGVAFLESLSLAHGDLRPENILIHHDRLKLADFDCTAEVGSNFEACVSPWGRVLNASEADQGPPGTFGYLGSRTELFALGSLYYLINHGFEPYGDRLLTDDLDGPNIVNLLQNMVFPEPNCDQLIEDIINKCWRNKYASVAELAARTQALLAEETNQGTVEAKTTKEKTPEEEINKREPQEGATTTQWLTAMGRLVDGLRCKLGNWWMFTGRTTDEQAITAGPVGNAINDPPLDSNGTDEDHSADDHSWKEAFCQDLEKRGLLELLSADEAIKLGFPFEFYRYSS